VSAGFRIFWPAIGALSFPHQVLHSYDIVHRPLDTRRVEQIPCAAVPCPYPTLPIHHAGVAESSSAPRLEIDHHFLWRVRTCDDRMDVIRASVERVQCPLAVATDAANCRLDRSPGCAPKHQWRLGKAGGVLLHERWVGRGIGRSPPIVVDHTASAIAPQPGAVGSPGEEVGERRHCGSVPARVGRVRARAAWPGADASGFFGMGRARR